jgi:hypothetical protein
MKKLFSLIIVMLAVLVNAQNLPCESLLSNYPAPKVEFTSVVQTITSSMSIDGQEVQTVITQSIDYTNRRLLQETNAMGANMIMRFVDGKASMGMKMGEEIMNVPIPDENAKSLEAIFDQSVIQGVPQNFTVVSCDGQQSYAGLLSGEQVTISTEVPNLGTMISKTIFDANGKALGAVTTVSGRDMLMIFEEMTLDAQNYPTHIKMSMYQLKGDEATLFTATTIDTISYNQPLDDSLFAQ